jgi:hypothetical protein
MNWHQWPSAQSLSVLVTTNRACVLHVFLSGCACSVRTLFCFSQVVVTYAVYPMICEHSLVFSAHTSVQFCLSWYRVLFDTLYLLVIPCFLNNPDEIFDGYFTIILNQRRRPVKKEY